MGIATNANFVSIIKVKKNNRGGTSKFQDISFSFYINCFPQLQGYEKDSVSQRKNKMLIIRTANS